MTVSSHVAWRIRWQLNYSNRPIPGEILDIVTVDMGPGTDYLGLVWTCRPLGRADFEGGVTEATASLRVG